MFFFYSEKYVSFFFVYIFIMINIKSILLRLYLLTYSPFFPILLTSIFFMTYKIYFEPVILCDDNGWTLFKLKHNLTLATADYRVAEVKCEQYYDLQEQRRIYKISDPYFSDPNGDKSVKQDLMDWQAKKTLSLTKVREIEGSIRKYEPGFQSPIKFNYYPRINKGY